MKNEVTKIFDDLDIYRDFCREEGFVFREGDLYNQKSYWGLYDRSKNRGLIIENQWEKGAKIFRRNIHLKQQQG